MARGPQPQSGEIQEAKGNPGHRRIVKTPDGVGVLAGQAPDWITDPHARGAYDFLLEHLSPMRLLRQTDLIALARYCDHFGRWLKLRSKVDVDGETYETDSKHGRMQRINPDLTVMLRVEDKMQNLEDRLGLTPASRQRALQQMAALGMKPGGAAGDAGGDAGGGDDDLINAFAPQPSGAAN